MATAILNSLKQGAYIAIALYVVVIAVVTVVSLNPQLNAPSQVSVQSSAFALDGAAERTKGRAS
jgi:hypothetical protein